MGDQIQEFVYQAGRKIKAAFIKLGENIRTLAESVSGRMQSWTDTRRQKIRQPAVRRQPAVQRIKNAELQDATAGLTATSDQRKKRKFKPIRRRSRQRVYRLLGYTTVSKINSRRKSEKRQRLLRQLLLILIIVLVIILLFHLYNPIRDLTEWYRIIGIKDLKELAGTQSDITPTPAVTPTITPVITVSPATTAN